MKQAYLGPIDEKTFTKYFKAFGDSSRLRIIMLLSTKEMTVNEIVKEIGLAQPTISRHLAILREAGVVRDRREAQRVFYSLNKSSIESCCEGFCCCVSNPGKKNKKC